MKLARRAIASRVAVRKTLTAEQKAQSVESFGAEGAFLSAGNKLIDTRDRAFKAVTAVHSRLVSLWRALTSPYPKPGIRLIRQDDIGVFTVQAITLKAELNEAVERLDEHFSGLKAAARDRLGSLYNDIDNRASLRGAVPGRMGFSFGRAS